jgi:ABC-type transport system substrate-binding protein
MAALQSGDVNFAEYVPSQFVEQLQADENFTVFQGYDIYNYIRLNVNRAPMDNQLVRQALNYAIDREAIIDLAFVGLGVPTTAGLIPPNDPVWYSQELDGHWTYDPDKALELLAEAGYEDPSALSFTLESSSEPNHLDSAQIIVEQWRAIGISAELQPLESSVRVDKRFSGDYTIMFDGAANPWTDPDFYSLYISTEGPVYAAGIGFSNADIDRLLAEGRSTVDEAARKAIYLELETLLLEIAPFVFINFRPQAEACAANVKGYVRVPGVGSASAQFMEWLWIDEE